MLTAESSGSVLANLIPLVAGATISNSGGAGGVARQLSIRVATRNGRCFRKGRQYSVKTFGSLAILLLWGAVACREKPIDQGALITARTVGLEHLQRGRLAEAEQEFRNVIALAPRDALGYANLGLTYLRAGRYADAEVQLQRARRLDPKNADIALITAKLYALTARPADAHQVLADISPDARVLYALAELERQNGDSVYAERLRQVLERSPANLAVRLKLADVLLQLGKSDSTIRYLEDVRRLRPEPTSEENPHLEAAMQALRAGRLADARDALDRFLRLIEVTAPYQAALAQVDGIEGPLAGRPVLAFSPQSLITMRGIASAPTSGQIRFTDVTGESGLPELGGPPTALAFGDYDGDGEDNLLLATREAVRLYAVQGGFAADVSARMPLPLPAGVGAIAATFADYDNDGWLDVFAIGTDGHGYLLHNREGKRFEDVTAAAGVREVAGTRKPLFVDLDHDGDLDLLLVGGGSLGVYRNNLDGTFTMFPNADGIVQGGTDAAFVDLDDDGTGRCADRIQLLPPALQRDSIGPLIVADIDGDGDQDIILGDRSGVHFLRNDGGNAHLAMRVQLTALGLGSGKNNSFGIGSRLEVRAGELYQTRVVTGPVTPFGLGSHFKADVLRVQWTNGVPQTIYFPGTDQDVLELQQLKGSCAFLYTWDGKRFRFITDMMWRSALGMPLGIMGGKGGTGATAADAPAGAAQEYLRIPGEALQPRNGRYVLQVTEELWETAYLDQLRLLAVDHPDSVDVFVDERFPPP